MTHEDALDEAASDEADDLADICKRLASWAGGTARLWDYTCSHRTLQIRLTHPSRPKTNAHLVCIACVSICAPAGWVSTDLRIAEVGNTSLGHAPRFRVEDNAAQVLIVCDLIEITDDVEPVY